MAAPIGVYRLIRKPIEYACPNCGASPDYTDRRQFPDDEVEVLGDLQGQWRGHFLCNKCGQFDPATEGWHIIRRINTGELTYPVPSNRLAPIVGAAGPRKQSDSRND